ncbi:glycosyltransferase [Mycolicibacterium sp. F2034L]|uniref:glycosyltransferase n=1 Tax=Mycolicibacterium sp. F2034L TaxID=2926422 RepID=UPI001FF61BD4|nr:glycosyltransferase [Mycolicibacterium sp. F2034L]MCK0173777.1 glycosyltransferase [Mycolicibacterium sp. F2034L]
MLHFVPFAALPVQVTTLHPLLNIRRLTGNIKADFAFIDQPLFSARACGLAHISIYRPTDIVEGRVANMRQRRILERVDGVVATSDHVLNSLRLERDVPSMVMPNGVDLSHFEGSQLSGDMRRGVVYVGAIDKRFDWHQMVTAAQLSPHINFDVYGPLTNESSPLPSNISIMGTVQYEALPQLLRRYEVGVLPLADIPLNRGRSPMKLFEYLAAGLQVVVTSTPTILKQADGARGIKVVSPADFAAAVASSLQQPIPTQDLITEAREHTWIRKAAGLIDFAQELAPRS